MQKKWIPKRREKDEPSKLSCAWPISTISARTLITIDVNATYAPNIVIQALTPPSMAISDALVVLVKSARVSTYGLYSMSPMLTLLSALIGVVGSWLLDDNLGSGWPIEGFEVLKSVWIESVLRWGIKWTMNFVIVAGLYIQAKPLNLKRRITNSQPWARVDRGILQLQIPC